MRQEKSWCINYRRIMDIIKLYKEKTDQTIINNVTIYRIPLQTEYYESSLILVKHEVIKNKKTFQYVAIKNTYYTANVNNVMYIKYFFTAEEVIKILKNNNFKRTLLVDVSHSQYNKHFYSNDIIAIITKYKY